MEHECGLLGKCELVFAIAYIMNSVLMFYLGKHFESKRNYK